MTRTCSDYTRVTHEGSRLADTNFYGDIFGGWLLYQADIAGGTVATQVAWGRVATVAVNELRFLAPVLVGDLVTCTPASNISGPPAIKNPASIVLDSNSLPPLICVPVSRFRWSSRSNAAALRWRQPCRKKRQLKKPSGRRTILGLVDPGERVLLVKLMPKRSAGLSSIGRVTMASRTRNKW
jgi:hypothetical protein